MVAGPVIVLATAAMPMKGVVAELKTTLSAAVGSASVDQLLGVDDEAPVDNVVKVKNAPPAAAKPPAAKPPEKK